MEMEATRTARWDITPRGNTGAADIVNLRYKSCSEMEGQDQGDLRHDVIRALFPNHYTGI
jgi:hypothetical protein